MSHQTPSTMTAIEISEPGGPEVLKPHSMGVPTPGLGQVVVKVAAAGVNRPDVVQRMGFYPAPPGASEIPGLEIAGEIVDLGAGVADLNVGDRICALVAGGGYAEYCLVDADLAMPVPEGFSMVEAAALPETFFTVWTNVFDRAKLQPGESILIHGGSSGIGTTAIQLAQIFGSRVFVTAGSEDKCKACVELGAERAINYRDEDFVKIVRELTDGKGVNVVLDMVGGDYVERNIECMADSGRMVSIAFLQGSKVEVNLLPVMLKRLTLTGSTLRPRTLDEKAAIATSLREKVWPLLSAGRVKPVIHETFPYREAAKAHALMESSAHIGKIMLEMAD